MTTESLTELLDRWKTMLGIYNRMAGTDYGSESPERNMLILTMANELKRRILELEAVMYKDPIRMQIAKSINKANDES